MRVRGHYLVASTAQGDERGINGIDKACPRQQHTRPAAQLIGERHNVSAQQRFRQPGLTP